MNGINMIYNMRMAVAGLAALGLAACAPAQPQTETAPAAASDQSLGQRLGVLPPQELEAGACGLFLWARGSRANLVFFTSDSNNQGHIVFDDRAIALPRTLADGELLFGQYTRQQFAGEALILRLAVQPDRDSRMIGGTVVRHGTLSIEDAKGWSIVMPVAGMIACKSA
jgi:hypothetical protein